MSQKHRRIKHPQVAMCQYCKCSAPEYTLAMKDNTCLAVCTSCYEWWKTERTDDISIIACHKRKG